jgi:hypothetical protein
MRGKKGTLVKNPRSRDVLQPQKKKETNNDQVYLQLNFNVFTVVEAGVVIYEAWYDVYAA